MKTLAQIEVDSRMAMADIKKAKEAVNMGEWLVHMG